MTKEETERVRSIFYNLGSAGWGCCVKIHNKYPTDELLHKFYEKAPRNLAHIGNGIPCERWLDIEI